MENVPRQINCKCILVTVYKDIIYQGNSYLICRSDDKVSNYFKNLENHIDKLVFMILNWWNTLNHLDYTI